MLVIIRPWLIVLVAFGLCPMAMGQNWGKLGNGLLPSARTIYADSAFDKLIVGGSFRRVVNGTDSVDVMGIAAWDGQQWDSLAARIQTVEFDWQVWVGPLLRFMRYQGQLYANGYISMLLPDSTYLSGVGRLNEVTMQWEPFECDFFGGISYMTTVLDDTMYFTGGMTQFCDTFPETCVVQFDGEHFRPFEPYYSLPYYSGNIANLMFDYNGQRYMGGLFTTNLSPLEYYDLVRFNAGDWEPVPGFTNQGNITSALVHDGKLYIAGSFREYQGAPGNCIAVFDGTSWDNLGGGMLMDLNNPDYLYPAISEIALHNGELIAVGSFNFAGDVPASNIAKWNGVQWCSYGGYFDQSVDGIAIWHDTLYITGDFFTIDGEHYGHVARWDGGAYTEDCSTPVGLSERPTGSPVLHIQPNPVTDYLTVVLPEHLMDSGELLVTDALGRVLLEQRIQVSGSSISVAALSSGTYMVRYVSNDGTSLTTRFIKR
jgi:hypothetical protein